MKLRVFLTIVIVIAIAQNALAEEYQQIIDLTKKCYFNKGGEAFPFVKNNNIKPDAIHFYLNLKRHGSNLLLIEHGFPFAIFIEGELKKFADENRRLVWDIDSLGEVIEKDRVLVTVFSEDKSYDDIRIAIVKEILLSDSYLDVYKVEERAESQNSILLIILLVNVIFLAAIINTNRKTFLDFYSFGLIVFGRVKDESIYKSKLFSQSNLLVYIFHASLLSYLLVLLGVVSNRGIGFDISYFDSIVFNWMMYTILILAFFLFKFLLIKYLGSLFDLGSAANYYYYEFMRMSMVFFLALFILVSAFTISFPTSAGALVDICIYLIVAFVSLRFFILFIRIGKIATFKKVHLFSYLCTTESVPILIGLKFLIF